MSEPSDDAKPPRVIEARVGDYDAFVEQMQQFTLDYQIPNGRYAGDCPLRGADLSHRDNFLNSIYRAWAAVLEVLTFYQDRIINEGYIFSAREQFSLKALLYGIGEPPQVALAAKTWLAFTLLEKSTSTEYVIPKGTQVQNIPDGGMPAVFETIHSFIGKPSWNQLRVHPPSPVSSEFFLKTTATVCCVKPNNQNIKPHTHLLLTGSLAGEHVHYLVKILEILKRKDGSLLIAWDSPLDASQNGTITNPKVYWFAEQYKAFGFDAADWLTLSPAVRHRYEPRTGGLSQSELKPGSWVSLTAQLPISKIQALLNLGDGWLLVGGESGVYESRTAGNGWRKLSSKLTERNITCLQYHAGALYAGSDAGTVLVSYDQGANWQLIRGNRPLTKSAKKAIDPGMLPAVMVNAIAVQKLIYKDIHTATVIYCGTAKGVFYSYDAGRFWHSGNELFSYHNQRMPHDAVIHHIQVTGEEVCASTSKGIYFAKITADKVPGQDASEIKPFKASILQRLFHVDGELQRYFTKENSNTNVLCSIDVAQSAENYTLFSTTDGLFRLYKGEWIPTGEGLIPDETGAIPTFNELANVDAKIVGSSTMGVYVSEDGGHNWALISDEKLYMLPDTDAWQISFNENRIPEDFTAAMALNGLLLSDSVQVKKTDDANWVLRDVDSPVLEVKKTDNGLTCCVNGDTSDKSAHLTIGSPDYYLARLEEGKPLSVIWYRLFSALGVSLGQKAQVNWNEDRQAWVIYDKLHAASYLIETEQKTTTISRIHSPNRIAVSGAGPLYYGGPTMDLSSQEWPDFRFKSAILPLSRALAHDAVGKEIYLQQEKPWPKAQSSTVVGYDTSEVDGFGKKAKVLSLHLNTDVVSNFDRRSLAIYGGRSDLVMDVPARLSHAPIQAPEVSVMLPVAPMPVGHNISIQGSMACLQFSPSKPGEKRWASDPLVAKRKDGTDVNLERDFAFSFPATQKHKQDLAAGLLTLDLYKLFLTKDIALTPAAQLYELSDSSWYIDQPEVENYLLLLDDKATTVEVYREYCFPMLGVRHESVDILYRGENLHLQGVNTLTLRWLPAGKTSPSRSEIAELAAFVEDGEGTVTLLFKEKFTNLYDPATLQLRANVVEAVHGESVKHEVLGSVVHGKPFQEFTLRRGPITTYQDDAGNTHNFLQVYIRRGLPWQNGNMTLEKWNQIDSVFKSPAEAPDYQLIGGDGNTNAILFGNGLHGRVPHSGVENVLADYRFGGGSAGNLSSGAIKVLRSKPRGVKKVFNPVAATGGADPAPINSMRKQSPAKLKNNGVIVAPLDCLYFCQGYAGVRAASYAELRVRDKDVVLISVALEDKGAGNEDALCREIVASMNARKGHKALIKVVATRFVYFTMAARIVVGDIARWTEICRAIKASVLAKFSEQTATPGMTVEASVIVALIQATPGVVGVTLDRLALQSEVAVQNTVEDLVPEAAHHDAGTNLYQGDQMLLTTHELIKLHLANTHE